MKEKNRKEFLCALILSGGNSERMNEPKAFLKIGNDTFLEKIISVYLEMKMDKIIIVLNKDLYSEKLTQYFTTVSKTIEIISNHFPGLGRLHSIKLGIQKLKQADFCFIQNIDNPFIDAYLLNILKKSRNRGEYVLPVFNGKGGHPVLISKKIIHYIANMEIKEFSLRDVLKYFYRKEVKVNFPAVLLNINTKEEYEKFLL